MFTVDEALRCIEAQTHPLPAELVPLERAAERCLAEALVARFDLPGFDNSAMDGYAVRFAEARELGEGSLPVVGESRAGGTAPDALPPGSAMRIFTGAPMPAGADTVIAQEDTERLEPPDPSAPPRLRLKSAPRARGRHVRLRGSDLAAGATALPAGTSLGAGALSLLASQGAAEVRVRRRPRVAILSTGDELTGPAEAGVPGRVVNSNAYALSALVQDAGGVPELRPPASDTLQSVVSGLSGLDDVDALLCTGGVSVGDYDVVGDALASLGMVRHFWKVAIKPGKPLLFGTLGGRPVFGLPGNPVSAMVTFEVFVRPALRRLQGDATPARATLPVRLSQARGAGHGRTEYARAQLSVVDGELVARLLSLQGSGSLPSMVGADALVIFPAGHPPLAEGARVRALPLRPLGVASAAPREA